MIQLAKEYLVIDGEKHFIYAGDFSYGRIPRNLWRDRLLAMKAAGINAISFYCVWRYHELEDDVWNFSGNRDVDALLTLIKELDLYAIYRLGPFVHGEFRNGGYPDFLVKTLGKRVRSNDEAYLAYAKRFYEKFLAIGKKHLWDNGGAIILLQLENELGSAGCKGDDIPRGDADPAENYKHLEFYCKLVRESGITLPFLDINKVDNRDALLGAHVDTGGHYPAACFSADGELSPMTPRANTGVPYLTIETGAGMFVRFFDYPRYRHTNSYQGPIVTAASVEALAEQTIAEGANGVGFFIFCDGQHYGEDNESMIPFRNMNFQAPLSYTGTLRASYKALKRLGWFVRSFEQELLQSHSDANWSSCKACGMPLPGEQPSCNDLFNGYGREINAGEQNERASLPVEHLARVTTGLNLSDSNFLFLRNVRNGSKTWLRDIRVATTPNQLGSEVFHEFPKLVQMELPPQTNKIMPFYVKLCEKCFLDHSTATLLDRRAFGDRTQVILHATLDEFTETEVVVPYAAQVRTTPGLLAKQESPNMSILLGSPSRGMEVADFGKENALRLVLVDTETAGNVWNLAELAAFTTAQIVESRRDGETICFTLLSDEDCFSLDVLTPEALQLSCDGAEFSTEWDRETGHCRYTGNFPGHEAPEMKFNRYYDGSDLRLEAVVDAAMLEDCEDVVLHIEYDGDGAQAYLDETLICDHYYGKHLEWEVSLKQWFRSECATQLLHLNLVHGRDCRITVKKLKKYACTLRMEALDALEENAESVQVPTQR